MKGQTAGGPEPERLAPLKLDKQLSDINCAKSKNSVKEYSQAPLLQNIFALRGWGNAIFAIVT